MSNTFNKELPVVMGADHAGVEYKAAIKEALEAQGFKVDDKGTYTTDSVDYPDFAHPVASDVEEGKVGFGILICGSGNGVAITANKHKGVRAALCWNVELAQLARQHNNANVLCIPARFITLDVAKEMVQAFISTAFEGGRHENRVNKISC